MFLKESWGIAYENTKFYENFSKGKFYPFNDVVFYIICILIIIFLIINIAAWLLYKYRLRNALNETYKKPENKKEKKEKAEKPEKKENPGNTENVPVKISEPSDAPEEESNADPETENELVSTITSIQERKNLREKEELEDREKLKKSKENEEKIESDFRRRIRQKD